MSSCRRSRKRASIDSEKAPKPEVLSRTTARVRPTIAFAWSEAAAGSVEEEEKAAAECERGFDMLIELLAERWAKEILENEMASATDGRLRAEDAVGTGRNPGGPRMTIARASRRTGGAREREGEGSNHGD